MNKNNPTMVSSSTQHPYNYDGKETLLRRVATIGAEMNQQTNIIFPQLVTSSMPQAWIHPNQLNHFLIHQHMCHHPVPCF
jgi:hypothetical protein